MNGPPPGTGATSGLGLVLVVLGPAWDWLLRPFRSDARGDADREGAPESASAFRFDHDRSTDVDGNGDDLDPLTAEFERLFASDRPNAEPDVGAWEFAGGDAGEGESAHPDWVSSVFDNDGTRRRLSSPYEVPAGDFLRSSSGSGPSARNGSERATDGSFKVELANRPPVAVQRAKPVEASTSTAGAAAESRSNGEPDDDSTPNENPSPVLDGDDWEWADVDEAADSGHRPSGSDLDRADRTRAGAAGAHGHDERRERSSPADSPSTSQQQAGSVDVAEDIAAAVATARDKLERVADGLPQPGTDADAARETVADITADAEATLELLWSEIPGADRDVSESLEALRADQTRIEAARDSITRE